MRVSLQRKLLGWVLSLTGKVIPFPEDSVPPDVADGGESQDREEDEIGVPLCDNKSSVRSDDGRGADELGWNDMLVGSRDGRAGLYAPAKKPWTVTTTSHPTMFVQPTQKLYHQ